MTLLFRDIMISPFDELLDNPTGGAIHRGGPHWSNFAQQRTARHCRYGSPVDAIPRVITADRQRLDEMAAWGGPIVRHFGHQVADFSMRLLGTAMKHPGVPMVFSSHPRMRITSVQDVPGFVRDVWEWCGISHQDILVVTEPTEARELVVEPQAEQIGHGPDHRHLDMLDDLTLQRLGTVDPIPAVYVSRAGVRARFAGEAYIEQVLTASGVTVVRPETLPLSEQLRLYASAQRLIVAEGSALHATQLLGRCLGDVSVIVRRSGKRIAEASVAPRARSLTYRDATVGVIHGVEVSGEPATGSGLSILDPEVFVESLTQVVPEVSIHFRDESYRHARDLDIITWFDETPRRWAVNPGSAAQLLGTLRAAGLGHLEPHAKRVLTDLAA